MAAIADPSRVRDRHFDIWRATAVARLATRIAIESARGCGTTYTLEEATEYLRIAAPAPKPIVTWHNVYADDEISCGHWSREEADAYVGSTRTAVYRITRIEGSKPTIDEEPV